jgi:hypothetical protein
VHFEVHFTAQSLRIGRSSRGEREEARHQAEAREKDLRPFSVHCEKIRDTWCSD